MDVPLDILANILGERTKNVSNWPMLFYKYVVMYFTVETCFFVYIFLYPAVMANVNERENLNEFTLAGSAFPWKKEGNWGAKNPYFLNVYYYFLLHYTCNQACQQVSYQLLSILQTVNHSSYLRVWSRCPNRTIFLTSVTDGTQMR